VSGDDHNQEEMRVEQFLEFRPADEGRNLIHWRGHEHITGPACPCAPGSMPHDGTMLDPDGPAVVIDDRTHECVFVEEEEPSGRLILPPCIVCGCTAMDAVIQLRDDGEVSS
jgi:hypothetical protein